MSQLRHLLKAFERSMLPLDFIFCGFHVVPGPLLVAVGNHSGQNLTVIAVKVCRSAVYSGVI